MQRPTGYSLVEILVSLSLAGIGTLFVVETVHTLERRSDLAATASFLESDLRRARVHAMSRGAIVETRVDIDAGTWSIRGGGTSLDGLRAFGPGVVVSRSESTGIVDGVIPIRFDPEGLSGRPATVSLRNGSRVVRVVVNAAGRVRVAS